MVHSKGKKNQHEPTQKKKNDADIVDKDFKATISKILKDLKERMEKVKKMVCEQNGNISKEIDRNPKKRPKRNSGTEMSNK